MSRRPGPGRFPLLRRELRLLARDLVLGLGLVGFLALMLGAWVPLMSRAAELSPAERPGGGSLLAGLIGLHWLLAGLVAPWAVTRLLGLESRTGGAQWARQWAVPPWRAITAALAAIWVYFVHLLLLPVPLHLIAASILEADRVVLLRALFELGCWLLLLAPATLLAQAAARGFLGRLALSYLTAGVLALVRYLLAAEIEGTSVGIVMLVAGGGLTALLLTASRDRLLYEGS